MAISTNKETVQTRDIYIGAAKAPVTLVCYMDYESAACARLNVGLNELLALEDGNLRVNIRHFPLAGRHQKAMKAAEAVVAAAQEGLFWEMHNELFRNQKKLGTISLKQYAKDLGSANKRFLDQLINGTYAWQVREDLMEGVALGVKDVPAVFVNGIQYHDEFTAANLHAAITQCLPQ